MIKGRLGGGAVKTLALTVLLGFGTMTANNFYKHNTYSTGPLGERIYRKMNGLFHNTTVIIHSNGAKGVTLDDVAEYTTYWDNDGDGEVDKAYYGTRFFGNRGGVVILSDHELNEANKIFEEEMERFKPLIKEYSNLPK